MFQISNHQFMKYLIAILVESTIVIPMHFLCARLIK